MILVKLRGGLSNQMFQYAAARRLAAVHQTSVRIDTTWYQDIPTGATPRTYELHHLRITGAPATRWELIGTDGLRNTPRHAAPIALYRKARPRYRFIAERDFPFDPEVLDLPDQVCLFGYWVSEKYFADAAQIIRDEYRFRNAPSAENQDCVAWMRDTESVAIHVRRGDYANDPSVRTIHGLCDIGYYRRCIRLVRQRVQSPYFFVFSDNLDWAWDNLPLRDDVHYVENNYGPRSYEDLRLMSAAKHNVIANSGFSWWAAWLNTNATKLVWAPHRWMSDPAFDTSDVLPSDWIAV